MEDPMELASIGRRCIGQIVWSHTTLGCPEDDRSSGVWKDSTSRVEPSLNVTERLLFGEILRPVNGRSFPATHDGALIDDLGTDS